MPFSPIWAKRPIAPESREELSRRAGQIDIVSAGSFDNTTLLMLLKQQC